MFTDIIPLEKSNFRSSFSFNYTRIRLFLWFHRQENFLGNHRYHKSVSPQPCYQYCSHCTCAL